MSYVATVVIYSPYMPDEVENMLSEGYVQSDGRRNWFGELSALGSPDPAVPSPWDLWGGQKGPEASVWGGAFNYLNYDELHAWLASLPWTDKVGVMWEANGDTGLRIWTFGPDDHEAVGAPTVAVPTYEPAAEVARLLSEGQDRRLAESVRAHPAGGTL